MVRADLVSRYHLVAPADLVNRYRLVAPAGLVSQYRLVAPEDLVSRYRLVAPEVLVNRYHLVALEDLVSRYHLVARVDLVSRYRLVALEVQGSLVCLPAREVPDGLDARGNLGVRVAPSVLEVLEDMDAADNSSSIIIFRIRGTVPPYNQVYFLFYSLLNLLYIKIGLLIPSQTKTAAQFTGRN